MSEFSDDILALAAIVKLAPEKLRPFRSLFEAELVSGVAATSIDIQIPTGTCAVITNIAVDSYPKIAASFDYTKRQAYSYADQLLFQWSKDGALITPQEDYHLWHGETFFASDQGKLTLAVQLNNLGTLIDSQWTNIALDGLLLPRTAPSGPVLNVLSRMSVRRV